MMNESRRSKAHFDYILTVLAIGLAAFGVLSVSIASFSTDAKAEDTLLNYIVASSSGLKQMIFFLISPIVIGFVTFFPHDFIRRRSQVFYLFACFLLMVALGGQAAGVKAWIDFIWGYTLQPSEFVKLACIITTAKYLEKTDNPLGTGKSSLRLILLMGFPWALTLAQGETGSVLVMVFVFGVMLYFGGIRMKVMGGIIAAGVLALIILYGVIMASGIEDYRITRILSFVNPDLVDANATYQVSQSKIAIGAGGTSGIGAFVQGSWSQLDYVPQDHTDFIFSTIGEAYGFWGLMAVLGAYLLMLLRMTYLAYFTQERFGQMVIIGVMSMMLFHVFQNVAMTIGLMPITGIPLPFLSYGGSNLVTNMAGIGLVLNMVMNRSVTSIKGLTPQTRIKGRYTG
ncbi:MAG TPA: FtsW/RodA/SpoVE family cell cycle protein [Candidatus Limiplasma sp.]|nr:FtsW/RodA/SpoVE family cell cycle protein [Candidatus Limiplasma sp.]HRX09060.1 FtsW/RodA/SpoVE family cell cycle protein [Candidatus Limiplasma sp.]